MQEFSNILKKPVVSLYDCTIHGTATKLFINKKWKCVYIGFTDHNIDYIISTKDILNHNLDSITIKNNSIITMQDCMTLTLNTYYNIIDNPTYNINGEYMGVVNDIRLNSKYYIENITLDSGATIEQNMLFNISNNLVLIKNKDSKLNRYKYKPKSFPKLKTIESNTRVTIENSKTHNHTTLASIKPAQSVVIGESKTKPTDSSLLLKRIATRTLTNTNGEVIVRENSKITQDIVKKARLNGKLFELIKYSK